MPVDPPQDHPSSRSAWSRRAAQGSAAALAALTALGPLQAAHAAPASPQTVHVAQQHGPSQITVAPGDSLWSLATAHGVTVKELMAANSVPAHGMLRPGQRLTVPGSPAAPRSGKAPHAPASGDDAAPAPRRTPTTAARSSSSGSATPPSGSPAGRRHTVAPGDTLWELSQRYGVSVSQLMSANDLSAGSVLRPGRTLTVPGGPATAPPAASSGAEATPQDGAAGEPAAEAARPAVGTTFAGREYPREVTASANRHHAELQRRAVPSPEKIREMVAGTARAMGVDPALALAHASQESGFRHDVVSPADAVGTMQVIPSAGQWASAMVGRDLDLLDPQDNITAGVAVIRELQDRAPDKATGIGAYYQGLHGVRTYGMYPDTKAYVKAVSAQERKFAQ
ncbi:LysM peptidoglycan-binding domain-containing protein [Kocuria tytonicola]|uniref:LysM peptidoglycan-binding domain-containing protein n=1 Tax=Kocuria tytonicola TaxID=2055946 RepID=A0A3L9KXT3_9MICC|nr:LysM peptidoglycan-binding domain-containing protein [Kocuria tytonicola]RLY91175.1 LysM peptidoglycan-binding domain-containing protein [Kocuria tytonicola]